MKTTLVAVVITALAIITLGGCKKDDNPITTTDIYVVGEEFNSGARGARCWKNGEELNLTNAVNAVAYSVCVDNGDIHIVGENYNNSYVSASYWKNGIPVNMFSPSTSSTAKDVYVSGNDVYIAGTTDDRYATYWKNGTEVHLTDGNNYAEATGIYVSGNDVYVCGTESNGTVRVAKYWKNGIAFTLSDTTRIADAYDITVQGSDVYVAGTELANSGFSGYLIAKYWKNGTPVSVSDGISYSTRVNAIAVSGNDVYMAGIYGDGITKAAVWKNSIPTILPVGGSPGSANDIFISGNDVYIAGNEPIGSSMRAIYWKNGIPVVVSDTTKDMAAYSIFVDVH